MKSPLFVFALATVMPSIATAGTIEIRRDSVIEVVSDQDLSVRNARQGDRFSVTVGNDRDLPRDTQLIGEILHVEKKRDRQEAFMDLQFTSIRLPDGSRHRIDALPITLDNRNIRRERDGRMVANGKKVKSEYYVGGGLLGGLVLGSIFKKPFEGAFIGTLAGIILSETEKAKHNDEKVLRKGTTLGAVFLQDASLPFDDRYDRWGRDPFPVRDRLPERDRLPDRDRLPERDTSDRDRNGDLHGINLQYEGRTLSFSGNEQPYRQGNATMVPIDTVARQLGFQVDRVEDRLFIENQAHVVKLFVKDRGYRLDGARKGDLPAQVEERNGIIYVPAEVLALMLDKPIYVDGTEVKSPA